MRLDEERVGVAVERQVDEVQHVARALALFPEAVPRATVEVDLLRADRGRERLAVHVAEHEHRAGAGVLHDRRDEAPFVELRDYRHAASVAGRISTPADASAAFSAGTLTTPSWKMDAASAASAPVPAKSSTSTPSIPPPTQNGIVSRSATRAASSTTVRRRSADAVMSRNTSSSAPSESYRDASAIGSPASRSATKRVPFTTRPRSTSRHGMIRFASIYAFAAEIASRNVNAPPYRARPMITPRTWRCRSFATERMSSSLPTPPE